MVDYSTLVPMEQRANQLSEDATSREAAGATLPDRLRTAVSERFNNSPLIKQREGALSTFLTSPDRARASVAETVRGGTILSPTQQQAIMSGMRAADTVPLVSLNDLVNNQFGSISDIVGAGTNAYKADVAARQGKAGLAQEQYKSALARLVQQNKDEFEREQFDYTKAQDARELALQYAGLAAKGGGGSESLLGAADSYIAQINAGNMTIANVPPDMRQAVVDRMSMLGSNPGAEKTGREKSGVQGILDRLKEVYQGAEGTQDDLSGGRIMGPLARLGGMFGLAPRTSNYADLRKGAAGTLKSIIGETGVLTDQDLERIVGLLPGNSSTAAEAAGKWKDIDVLLNSKYKNANNLLPQSPMFDEMDYLLNN